MIDGLMPAVGFVIGGLVWGLRLEGRVNTADQRFLDLKELINSQFSGMDRRLERIERAMNGRLREIDDH